MGELLVTEDDIDLIEEEEINPEGIEEDYENLFNGIIEEDITTDSLLLEEEEIYNGSELEEEHIDELIGNTSNMELSESSETDTEDGETSSEEYISNIAENLQVIMANQKTQAENINLLNGIGLCIQCMFFGGFLIFCFLHRLG